MAKRRLAKRRCDPRAEAEAWQNVFDAGWDFFGDLEAFGSVELDQYGRPGREAAQAAWTRLGPYFLADRTDPREPWAVQQFGRPPHAR